jgi:DNA-binding MarR family transcriptional regulator
MARDIFDELGASALGSRLRRLSDRLAADVYGLYQTADAPFEPRWYPLFRWLMSNGAASISEAATALGTTHASVSQIARAMVAAGVAESSRDPRDERRRIVSLTRRGRSLGRKLQPLWDDISSAAQEVTTAAGRDLLPLLAAAEQALTERSLADRVAARVRERRLAQVRIVEFQPEHRDAFERLNLEWLQQYFEVEGPDREILGDPKRAVIDRGGAILMALDAQTPVGTCALIPGPHGLELAKMAVTSRVQGLGIGKRLLEAAIERARELGADRLFLLSHTKLSAAIGLYRKLGFEPLPDVPESGYTRCDVAMALDL